MAQRYPTYDSAGRRTIARTPGIDQAALREEAKGFSNMAAGANKIMNFAFGKLDQKAKVEGAQYGATNPQEAMKQTKGQSTTFDQYAFGAAVKVAGSQIETQARNQMGKALLEWKDSKGDPEELKARLFNINAGFSNAMGSMDAVSAAGINQTLTRLSNSVYLDYTEDWMKEQKASLKTNTMIGIDQRVKGLELMGRQNISPEQFDENLIIEIDELRNYMEGNGSTPTEIGNHIIQAQTLSQRSRVRGAFERAEDKIAFAAAFEKDFNKRENLARGLDEADQKTLLGEMNTKINSINSRNNAAKTELDNQFADLKNVVTDGLDPGDQLLKLKQQATELNHGELYFQIEQLEKNAGIYQRVRQMSVEGAQNYINELQNEQRIDTKTTPEERELLKDLESILSDITSDRADEEAVIGEAENIIDRGFLPGPKLMQKLQDGYERYKDTALGEKFDILLDNLGSLKKGETLNPLELEEFIKETETLLEAGVENQTQIDLIDDLKTMQGKMKTALSNDPLSWAKKTRDDFPNLAIVDGKVDTESANARINWVNGWSAEMAILPKYFTNNEKNTIISGYMAADVNNKIAFLSGLNESFGIHTMDVLEELHGSSKDGQNLAHIGALTLGGNIDIAEDAFLGMELDQESIKLYFPEGGTVKTDMDQMVTEAIFGAQIQGAEMGNISEVTRNAYTQRHIRSRLKEFDADLFQQTLQEAAGARFINGDQYGGIITFDPDTHGTKHQVMIPNNIVAEDFPDLIDSMDELDFFMNTGNKSLHFLDDDGKGKPLKNYERYRDRFHFTSISANEVVISLYPSTGDDPQYFVDENGERLILDLRELQDYMMRKQEVVPGMAQ